MSGRHHGSPARRDRALPARDAYKIVKRNPVRVLNDALGEYRTEHTTMSKDEFEACGAYDAFMWAWQHAKETE